ncbi:winged helix-turn-helix transcriptional regulator [Pseudothioglobus sp. nBUS_23]|jgi:DNA-binding HxlR family transcriptional regulator|uniref:winged helix-turn-helix transcriptional regulator n=1 Tax=Pseudothioglobus sp. nBUS_23 TaxID=3395318 RepID=UPI003EBC3A68
MSKINENESPTTAAIKLIGGKWKLCILWQLSQKKMRFGELQRAVGDITQQMLSKQLKEMSKDNLIKRKVYEVIPPKVEYSLTAFGKSGIPVLIELCNWASKK